MAIIKMCENSVLLPKPDCHDFSYIFEIFNAFRKFYMSTCDPKIHSEPGSSAHTERNVPTDVIDLTKEYDQRRNEGLISKYAQTSALSARIKKQNLLELSQKLHTPGVSSQGANFLNFRNAYNYTDFLRFYNAYLEFEHKETESILEKVNLVSLLRFYENPELIDLCDFDETIRGAIH